MKEALIFVIAIVSTAIIVTVITNNTTPQFHVTLGLGFSLLSSVIVIFALDVILSIFSLSFLLQTLPRQAGKFFNFLTKLSE